MKIYINPEDKRSKINKEIYGHFSEHLGRCIYNGIYVGENSPIPNTKGIRNDIIEAMKQIRVPVLRWPGGCFADEYHWKDGIGEKASRKKMINTHWGGLVEDNSFGTHEFMDFCELVGCEPYIAINVGSGSVQEADEWVEYMTFDGVSPMADLRRKNGREKPWKLKYAGIGNENWGCGGNMRPEYYADLYRRYETYCRDFSGNHLFKVASGPNGNDYNWTKKLLDIVKPWHTSAISLHYYTVPTGDWEHKGSATKFSDEDYYNTIRTTCGIEPIIKRHLDIMSVYDPEHKIGLIVDEWGTWYDVEEGTNPGFLYQQNTMRDAIVAAFNLNIFNNHSDRIVMANIAQIVNVLQSIILTEGDKMVKTPTYHVFDMFKDHQDATLVYSYCDAGETDGIPDLSMSVSENKNGLLLTAANASLTESRDLSIGINDFEIHKVEGRILSGDPHDFNDFDSPEKVTVKSFSDFKNMNGKLSVCVPPCSVIELHIG